MRRQALALLIVLLTAYTLPVHGQEAALYAEHVLIQHWLITLGYLDGVPNGSLDERTCQAIESFQLERGLQVTGGVNEQTRSLLRTLATPGQAVFHTVKDKESLWDISRMYGVSITILAELNGLRNPALIRIGQELVIPVDVPVTSSDVLLASFSEIEPLIANQSQFTIVDVKTQLSINLIRYHGYFHIDAEPMTKEDTQTLLNIYDEHLEDVPRPAWALIDGQRYAASFSGYPRGSYSIYDNGFAGHLCLHFLGSKSHATGEIEEAFQQAVLAACGYGM
ncbi:MAG: LysM peptidoglycan-binding domain-containing protein [Limnochordia bacterium]|nr:LysM peptidoglycan-binding domain-containing protein [Limnochordia bacterium]